jgi:hypothetical protein
MVHLIDPLTSKARACQVQCAQNDPISSPIFHMRAIKLSETAHIACC